MADSDNRNGNASKNLSAIELARAALTTVGELTGYRPEAATGLEWDGESWCVTVESLVYKVLFGDAGYKYRGFTAQGEWWYRKLDDLTATGPLPVTSINDRGGQLSLSYMVVPRQLAAYVSGSYIWDQFRRFPWEAGGGLSYYPSGTRSWRLNGFAMHVNKSPAASSFGYYVAGMTGTIFSLGTDILF